MVDKVETMMLRNGRNMFGYIATCSMRVGRCSERLSEGLVQQFAPTISPADICLQYHLDVLT